MSVSTIGSSRPDVALTAGIDWSSSEHAVAVVDEHGVQLQRAVVPHTTAGLTQLVRLLRRAGVEEIGIERGDGPMVDAVLADDFVVFVIPPNQVRNLRRRYGAAGNKDDHFDAYVLADTVRTDRHRLTPLVPDTPATVTMRMSVRARQDLVAARVAMANQLRAHLATVRPGPMGPLRDIDPGAHLHQPPEAGIVRAASLPAGIGARRSRLATVRALTTHAGAEPSSWQSGKAKSWSYPSATSWTPAACARSLAVRGDGGPSGRLRWRQPPRRR
jgi:hypothetical protein